MRKGERAEGDHCPNEFRSINRDNGRITISYTYGASITGKLGAKFLIDLFKNQIEKISGNL